MIPQHYGAEQDQMMLLESLHKVHNSWVWERQARLEGEQSLPALRNLAFGLVGVGVAAA